MELVAAVLKTVARKGLRGAEKELGGVVTYETIRRWRKGDVPPLRPDTREALENYLGRVPAADSPSYAEGAAAVLAETEAFLADLRRRLGLRGGSAGGADAEAVRAADRAQPTRGPGGKGAEPPRAPQRGRRGAGGQRG